MTPAIAHALHDLAAMFAIIGAVILACWALRFWPGER